MWLLTLILVNLVQIVLGLIECNNGCIGIAGCPAQEYPCDGNFCFFLRETTILPGYLNSSITKRGCLMDNLLFYRQNFSAYTLINTCSTVVIDSIDYHLKICDNENYCAHDCFNPQPYDPYTLNTPSPTYYPLPTTTTYYPASTTNNSTSIINNFILLFLTLLLFV